MVLRQRCLQNVCQTVRHAGICPQTANAGGRSDGGLWPPAPSRCRVRPRPALRRPAGWPFGVAHGLQRSALPDRVTTAAAGRLRPEETQPPPALNCRQRL